MYVINISISETEYTALTSNLNVCFLMIQRNQLFLMGAMCFLMSKPEQYLFTLVRPHYLIDNSRMRAKLSAEYHELTEHTPVSNPNDRETPTYEESR